MLEAGLKRVDIFIERVIDVVCHHRRLKEFAASHLMVSAEAVNGFLSCSLDGCDNHLVGWVEDVGVPLSHPAVVYRAGSRDFTLQIAVLLHGVGYRLLGFQFGIGFNLRKTKCPQAIFTGCLRRCGWRR